MDETNQLVQRKLNEPLMCYYKRLRGLVDGEIVSLTNQEMYSYLFSEDVSHDYATRAFKYLNKVLEADDGIEKSYIPENDSVEEIDLQIKAITQKTQELKKEQYKFYDQRNAYNKQLRDRARQEEINDIITRTIESGCLPKLEYVEAPITTFKDNTLLASLNDLHIGANIDNYFNKYNTDICKERFKKYIKDIVNISKRHQSEDCVIWCNGDVISGFLHKSIQITNKENVIQQIMIAGELISEFLAELSPHFKTVKFVSVAGNHSRLDTKDDSLKDERLDMLIEWFCEARLQNFNNVLFNAYDKIDSTVYQIDVRGLKFLGVHGDYDGSASKIQSLQMMVGNNVYAVLMGHRHHNATDSISGVKTIMAGSWIGTDDYAISKRLHGHPEQLISIVDENGIVCNYDIQF